MTPTVVTHVAHAGWDEHRYHGYRVFEELSGNITYFELVALGIHGRRIDRGYVPLLNDLTTVMTVADPRIWPLKTGRLVASYGRYLAGMSAGCIALEGALVGSGQAGKCAGQLSALAPLADAELEPEIRRRLDAKQLFAGFGVPFRPVDERMVALTRCVEARALEGGRHWSLLQRVAHLLRERGGPEPNIAGGLAAVALDAGFTTRDVAPLVQMCLTPMIVSNAVESARNRDAALVRLPDDCIDYQGKPPRESPRLSASEPRQASGGS